jgi:hypothetical protein
VTDMLDDCFPGTRSDDMVGEIHSKVVKRSKSVRVMTDRRRDTISSINTFYCEGFQVGTEIASGAEKH